MPALSHLNSLQALEMALRSGSLRAAAQQLGITPAAIGQRIRALEEHLDTQLLKRGPSGLEPSASLTAALPDLILAFEALERASDELDLRRTGDVHIVADSDWAELWLAPRLPAFRHAHPNILFNINGLGDVPMRLGAPDLRISATEGGTGEVLFHDVYVAVTGPDNTRRMTNLPQDQRQEGMPLLHTRAQRNGKMPGWVAWCRVYGHRTKGNDRGVVYPNLQLALPAARENIGFLVCSLSSCLRDLEGRRIVFAFPPNMHIMAPHPYRTTLRTNRNQRPQTNRFLAWLQSEAQKTTDHLAQYLVT